MDIRPMRIDDIDALAAGTPSVTGIETMDVDGHGEPREARGAADAVQEPKPLLGGLVVHAPEGPMKASSIDCRRCRTQVVILQPRGLAKVVS